MMNPEANNNLDKQNEYPPNSFIVMDALENTIDILEQSFNKTLKKNKVLYFQMKKGQELFKLGNRLRDSTNNNILDTAIDLGIEHIFDVGLSLLLKEATLPVDVLCTIGAVLEKPMSYYVDTLPNKLQLERVDLSNIDIRYREVLESWIREDTEANVYDLHGSFLIGCIDAHRIREKLLELFTSAIRGKPNSQQDQQLKEEQEPFPAKPLKYMPMGIIAPEENQILELSKLEEIIDPKNSLSQQEKSEELESHQLYIENLRQSVETIKARLQQASSYDKLLKLLPNLAKCAQHIANAVYQFQHTHFEAAELKESKKKLQKTIDQQTALFNFELDLSKFNFPGEDLTNIRNTVAKHLAEQAYKTINEQEKIYTKINDKINDFKQKIKRQDSIVKKAETNIQNYQTKQKKLLRELKFINPSTLLPKARILFSLGAGIFENPYLALASTVLSIYEAKDKRNAEKQIQKKQYQIQDYTTLLECNAMLLKQAQSETILYKSLLEQSEKFLLDFKDNITPSEARKKLAELLNDTQKEKEEYKKNIETLGKEKQKLEEMDDTLSTYLKYKKEKDKKNHKKPSENYEENKTKLEKIKTTLLKKDVEISNYETFVSRYTEIIDDLEETLREEKINSVLKDGWHLQRLELEKKYHKNESETALIKRKEINRELQEYFNLTSENHTAITQLFTGLQSLLQPLQAWGIMRPQILLQIAQHSWQIYQNAEFFFITSGIYNLLKSDVAQTGLKEIYNWEQYIFQFVVPLLTGAGACISITNLARQFISLPVSELEAYKRTLQDLERKIGERFNTLEDSLKKQAAQLHQEQSGKINNITSQLDQLKSLLNRIEQALCISSYEFEKIQTKLDNQNILSFNNKINKKRQDLEISVNENNYILVAEASVRTETPSSEFLNAKNLIDKLLLFLRHACESNYNGFDVGKSFKDTTLDKITNPTNFIGYLAHKLDYKNPHLPNPKILFSIMHITCNYFAGLNSNHTDLIKQLYDLEKKQRKLEEIFLIASSVKMFLNYLQCNDAWIESILIKFSNCRQNLQTLLKNYFEKFTIEPSKAFSEFKNSHFQQRASTVLKNLSSLELLVENKIIGINKFYLANFFSIGLTEYIYNNRYTDKALTVNFLSVFAAYFLPIASAPFLSLFFLHSFVCLNSSNQSLSSMVNQLNKDSRDVTLSLKNILDILEEYLNYGKLHERLVIYLGQNHKVQDDTIETKINSPIKIKLINGILNLTVFNKSIQSEFNKKIIFPYTLAFDPTWSSNFSEKQALKKIIEQTDKYQSILKVHIKNYFKLLRQYLTETLPSNFKFNNNSISDSIIIYGYQDEAMPLLLPKIYFESLKQHPYIKLLYEAEQYNYGIILPEYNLIKEGENYRLNLNFKLIEYGSKNSTDCLQITIATFDSLTVEAFSKIIFKEKEYALEHNINEFLLLAMYGSVVSEDITIGLSSHNSFRLDDSLAIWPAELPFIGLYKIFTHTPHAVFNYNHATYTTEVSTLFQSYVDDKENIDKLRAYFSFNPTIALNPSYLSLQLELIQKRQHHWYSIYERIKHDKQYNIVKEEIYGHYELLLSCIRLFSNIDYYSLSILVEEKLQIPHPYELDYIMKTNFEEIMVYLSSNPKIEKQQLQDFLTYVTSIKNLLVSDLNKYLKEIKNWINFIDFSTEKSLTKINFPTRPLFINWEFSAEDNQAQTKIYERIYNRHELNTGPATKSLNSSLDNTNFFKIKKTNVASISASVNKDIEEIKDGFSM